jgi:hydrogenase/urease accessory protein HupE
MPTPSRTAAVRRAAAPALLAAVSAALAHPGHDTAPTMGFVEGLLHLLTQPDHAAMLVLAVAAGVAGARAWHARRVQRRGRARRP